MADRNMCGCESTAIYNCGAIYDCAALKNKLRRVDFAIYDTVLYLDVYPHCEKALEYYHKLMKEREGLIAAINGSCGPVTFNDVKHGKWSWTEGPWPWEPEANK